MRLLAAGIVLASMSCAGSYVYVARTPSWPSAPKAPDCPLHIVNDWRYPGYVEIGMVEWDGSVGVPRTMDELYRVTQATVCEAGGDVVIARPNESGKYVRGIVLKQAAPISPARP